MDARFLLGRYMRPYVCNNINKEDASTAGGEEEEEEDDMMDAEAPGEEEIIDKGTDEPVVEGETPEGLEAEPALAVTEDMGGAGEAEHVPDLDGLAIEGKAVADPNESIEKESKPKKKKEPHFPRWYSLRG